MWVWVGNSSLAFLLSSSGLEVSSPAFGSGWISKVTLPRAEQAQPATKPGGFLHSWCSSLSSGCRAGWGKLCCPSQTSVGLLSFHYFPLGEEECPAAWRAQSRSVSICPTRSSFPPVFPQGSPRAEPPAMNKTLLQISIPFSTPYEMKGMLLFCRGVGRRCTCCLLLFL